MDEKIEIIPIPDETLTELADRMISAWKPRSYVIADIAGGKIAGGITLVAGGGTVREEISSQIKIRDLEKMAKYSQGEK